MERLTSKSCSYNWVKDKQFQGIALKLQEYENTNLTPAEIEQLQKENAELKARLEKSVELPCKVGDTIYFLSHFIQGVLSGEIEEIIFDKWGWKIKIKKGRSFEDRDLGVKFFVIKEEAEQALKGGVEYGNDN